MERMLIVKNVDEARTMEATLMLGAYFQELGMDYDVIDSHDLVNDATLIDAPAPAVPDYALAVVLGGDGTILRTADYLRGTQTPLLGINYGHLGFLSNPADDGVVAIVATALAGDVTEECRANVCVEVDFGEEAEKPAAGKIRRNEFFALNEVTVERGASGRIVDFEVLCDGAQEYATRENGIVVARATGSTAYALSAGGPLVAPCARGLVTVPLAPHALNSRALVTGPGEVVEVRLSGDDEHRDVRLFVDGRPLDFDVAVQGIRVTNGEVPTRLLRYKHKGFYDDIARVFFA